MQEGLHAFTPLSAGTDVGNALDRGSDETGINLALGHVDDQLFAGTHGLGAGHAEGLGQRIPKKHFGNTKLAPGMQVVLQTNFGPRAVTVEKVGHSVVDVDLNHPMAGKDLHFDVEIVEVREASAEEIEHGHVHGDGGHQH